MALLETLSSGLFVYKDIYKYICTYIEYNICIYAEVLNTGYIDMIATMLGKLILQKKHVSHLLK